MDELPQERYVKWYGLSWWTLMPIASAVLWHDHSAAGWSLTTPLFLLACVCHAGMVTDLPPPKTLFTRAAYMLPLLPVWFVRRLF